MDANKIKELRTHLGLTQEALARLIGVSLRTVLRWEAGTSEPRDRYIRRLEEIWAESRGILVT